MKLSMMSYNVNEVVHERWKKYRDSYTLVDGYIHLILNLTVKIQYPTYM